MTESKLKKGNKAMLISGITFTCLVFIIATVSAFNSEAPDPTQLSPRKKITYMASEEFAQLPEGEKVKYMRKVGRSRRMFENLDEQERKAVLKNTRNIMHKTMQKRMKQDMQKFFKMNKNEQDAFLDKMIEEMERHRKEREASGNRPPGPPPGDHKAMMQGILENTDSTTRAQMDEFHKRMEARRKQTMSK